MVTVRVVSAADVVALSAVFPEQGRAPTDRHIERFALQESGGLT